MAMSQVDSIRSQLLHRHDRLKEFLTEERKTPQLVQLLHEVESALERLSDGTYGICDVCHESIEPEYLRAEPLVVKNGQIRSIESTGLPLGTFFNAEYQCRKLHLAEGDVLCLYSDGLTEARNDADEEYSEAQLSALVTREAHRGPQSMIQVTLDDIGRFRAGSPKVDDLTIMVLRRSP